MKTLLWSWVMTALYILRSRNVHQDVYSRLDALLNYCSANL
jgi:uncharacterized membrane protein (DUF485 family)